jgi:hypothetical protein
MSAKITKKVRNYSNGRFAKIGQEPFQRVVAMYIVEKEGVFTTFFSCF